MQEAIYKQCVQCGCFYDIMAENESELCNRCYLQSLIANNKDKNLIEKYGVNKNGK